MECPAGLDVHGTGRVLVIRDGGGQGVAQGEGPRTPEGLRRWHAAPDPRAPDLRPSLDGGGV
jgi:hypothetical protein